jgi:hypothetical protein
VRRLALVAAVGLAAACSSPEAGRTRGGGPGADPGNHGSPVEIHGPKNMFHETPQKIEVAHGEGKDVGKR